MSLLSSGFNDAANAAQDSAGAAGDLLAASGYRTSRDAFYKAGETADATTKLEGQSIAVQKAQLGIQGMQEQRQLYRAQGGQRAEIAASGLAESGSALDIIRDTTRQGELQTQLMSTENQVLDIQGKININAYAAQAESYRAQGAAADSQASVADASAAGKIAAGAIHTGSSLIHFLTLGIF